MSGKTLVVLLWTALAFATDAKGQQTPAPCDLQSCFPKLTTNSSKLNALLVFGIFEAQFHEKCFSFAQADQCFKSALESCRDSSYIQKRLFYVDSWQKAKRLFDYICVDEFLVFHKHQPCLRDLATSEGIRLCDSHFNLKSTGSSMCGLPETVSACVEREAAGKCPDESVTPKIVKMVDMFLSNMLNINSSACDSVKIESETRKETQRPFVHLSSTPSQSATAQPVHRFDMTRRRHGAKSTPIPKRRKYDDEEEDEAALDYVALQLDRNLDRWYRPGSVNFDAHALDHDRPHRENLDFDRPKKIGGHEEQEYNDVVEDEGGRRVEFKSVLMDSSQFSRVETMTPSLRMVVSLLMLLLVLAV